MKMQNLKTVVRRSLVGLSFVLISAGSLTSCDYLFPKKVEAPIIDVPAQNQTEEPNAPITTTPEITPGVVAPSTEIKKVEEVKPTDVKKVEVEKTESIKK